VRVIAGEFRGRRLVAPNSVTTRPTTDRVREAMFNSLVSMDLIADCAVVDAFAGSGALGIEALSRGAAHCTFVERDRNALDALRLNLTTLRLTERATVISGDVLVALDRVAPSIVTFADPPYDFTGWPELLAHSPSSFVVAESSGSIELAEGWSLTREKRYGRTMVSFVERLDD
jgi:16S rRNA (guanine966-N2)-methyltransferase